MFSERERAALRLTETVTTISEAGLPDELYHEVRQQFDVREFMDLISVINIINCWNRIAISTAWSRRSHRRSPLTIRLLFRCFLDRLDDLRRSLRLCGRGHVNDSGLERAHKDDMATPIARHRKHRLYGHLFLRIIRREFAELENSIFYLPVTAAANRAGLAKKRLKMSLKSRAAFRIQLHRNN